MTALLFLFACSDDPAAQPGTPSPTDGTTPAPVTEAGPDWSGTWRVEIDYSYVCDLGFGDMRPNDGTGTWSLQLHGSADDLEVYVNGNNWYTMTGSGSDDSLFLCGAFPMPDLHDDAAPSGNDNQICLDANVLIDAETLEGEATGHFQDSIGSDCTLDPSPLLLTR